MKVICLCGPVKFAPYFRLSEGRETMRGNVVLLPLLGFKQGPPNVVETLRRVHRRKIEMADEIIVHDIGGYIGDHTKEEIAYAESLGKVIRYYDKEDSTQKLEGQ